MGFTGLTLILIIFIEIKKSRLALTRLLVALFTIKDPSLACCPELNFDVKSACIFLDQLCCVDKRQSGTKMVDSDTEIRLPVLPEMVD